MPEVRKEIIDGQTDLLAGRFVHRRWFVPDCFDHLLCYKRSQSVDDFIGALIVYKEQM